MGNRAFALVCLTGCYTAAPATRDVTAAWQGHRAVEIEERWGAPSNRASDGPDAVLTWTRDRLHIELPTSDQVVVEQPVAVALAGANGAVVVEGRARAVATVFHPGAVWHTTTAAAAFVDPAGTITHVEGAALHWGPPNEANLHWGTIFGMHVGMGRLDATSTPLPSGGAYIGGMLNPTLGLVGTFALAAGTGDTGGAMGFGWGLAAQWWPANRVWLRAGPAMLLAFDPGFRNAGLHPGATVGASYAVVKVGVFALDLRIDLCGGPGVAFGTIGVGVNVN